MNKRYSANPLSFIFVPDADLRNNYNTIVFDVNSEEVLKLNPEGYKILKYIDENPQSDFNLLSQTFAKNKLSGFLDFLEKHKIVLVS
jgi:hypothetical protein